MKIKLTENELKNIIKESVEKVLKEDLNIPSKLYLVAIEAHGDKEDENADFDIYVGADSKKEALSYVNDKSENIKQIAEKGKIGFIPKYWYLVTMAEAMGKKPMKRGINKIKLQDPFPENFPDDLDTDPDNETVYIS